MMTKEQKQILLDMQWIPEEKQDQCEICGALIVDGKPVYAKASQRSECIEYDIKKIMDKIRERRKS